MDSMKIGDLFHKTQIQDVPITVYGPPPPDWGMNVVLTNKKTGEQISRWIYDEPLVAGRESPMPLLGDSAVSRQHMLFIRNGEALFLQDHSRNGTWVNGIRVDRDQTVPLQQNDCIYVGNTEYIISWVIA